MDTSLTAALPAGRYHLDPEASTIAFTTRHMFGAGAVRGTFAALSARARVDADGAELDATIDATSFSSGDRRRDAKVMSATFLDTENHPTMTFHADGFIPRADMRSLEGTLTVRGRSVPVVLTVTSVAPEGEGFVARAATTVDRYAFGVSAMRGMASRYLTLDITARFGRL